MGDRANVAILRYTGEENGIPDAVVLYTHWGGTVLPIDVQTALKRKVRWTDPSYLARIVFCTMLDGAELEGENGYGITVNALDDNNHPVLVLDTVTERIASRGEDDWRRPVRDPEGLMFEAFCRL